MNNVHEMLNMYPLNIFILSQLFSAAQNADNCFSNSNNQHKYRNAHQFASTSFKTEMILDALAHCAFGKSHTIDTSLCLDHCSLLQSNCTSIVVSTDNGCRFCLNAELDYNRHVGRNLSTMYIKEDVLKSECNYNFN